MSTLTSLPTSAFSFGTSSLLLSSVFGGDGHFYVSAMQALEHIGILRCVQDKIH